MSRPNPRRFLTNLRKPIITLPECAAAIEVEHKTLWARLRSLPEEEKPENCGAFRAGGYLVFVCDTAIDWCERHLAYWEKRQGEKKAVQQ